jgi:2-dehydro-3-deoxygluconokinase
VAGEPGVPDRRGVEFLTLGECLVGLVADAPGPLAEVASFERHVAGAEANVAVGVARLAHGSAFIGRVGDDGFGQAILRRLRGEGVDVSALVVDPAAPTGLLVRERRLLGPAEVLYYRRGSAASRLSREDVERAEGVFAAGRWLHLTGITPALSESCRDAVAAALELARAHRLTVSLDLNLRRKLWSDQEAAATLRPLVPSSDVVMGGLDEMALVGGSEGSSEGDPEEAAAAILALGARAAVVKLGAEGALELRAGASAAVHEPALAVPQRVDPVGAGDAFAAGYIVASLEGLAGAPALQLGNACGASVIAVVGDQSGLPTRREVERLVASWADSIR